MLTQSILLSAICHFVTQSPSHRILHGLIDSIDQPGEGTAIHSFGQGISGIDGVINCEWAEDLCSDTIVMIVTWHI